MTRDYESSVQGFLHKTTRPAAFSAHKTEQGKNYVILISKFVKLHITPKSTNVNLMQGIFSSVVYFLVI